MSPAHVSRALWRWQQQHQQPTHSTSFSSDWIDLCSLLKRTEHDTNVRQKLEQNVCVHFRWSVFSGKNEEKKKHRQTKFSFSTLGSLSRCLICKHIRFQEFLFFSFTERWWHIHSKETHMITEAFVNRNATRGPKVFGKKQREHTHVPAMCGPYSLCVVAYIFNGLQKLKNHRKYVTPKGVRAWKSRINMCMQWNFFI